MTVKPFPQPKRKPWPVVSVNIEGVTHPGAIRAQEQGLQMEFAAAYLSPTDPPPGWYKAFSAAQYMIERVECGPRGAAWQAFVYRLTPVVNRPVYTFDDWGDFIEASRNFTVALFTSDFITDVAQYRVRHGPPIEHVVYRLPPAWTWREP